MRLVRTLSALPTTRGRGGVPAALKIPGPAGFRTRFLITSWLLLAGLVLGLGAGVRTAKADEPSVPNLYRLDSTLPGAIPGLVNSPPAQEFVFALPASLEFDSLAGINVDDLASPHDRPRATYRYTWFSHPGWDLKIGLSTTLDAVTPWQRFPMASEHLHVGSLPTMHLSGQGRLADHWLLSVNAEGLRTARGQGLDMDLRVDYSLSPNVALYGDYRLTDSSGDGAETYGFVPANSARLGVRLRF